MLNARALGIDVSLQNRTELERIGLEVRDIVSSTVELHHPTDPSANRVLQVQLFDPEPRTDGVDCRCVAIFGPGGFDLTPSGTSTCAHMAAKRAKGDMSVGDRFVMESVTGAVIQGRHRRRHMSWRRRCHHPGNRWYCHGAANVDHLESAIGAVASEDQHRDDEVDWTRSAPAGVTADRCRSRETRRRAGPRVAGPPQRRPSRPRWHRR